MRERGASDAQIADAKRELRAAFSMITSEEYGTRWEFTEAVNTAVERIAARF